MAPAVLACPSTLQWGFLLPRLQSPISTMMENWMLPQEIPVPTISPSCAATEREDLALRLIILLVRLQLSLRPKTLRATASLIWWWQIPPLQRLSPYLKGMAPATSVAFPPFRLAPAPGAWQLRISTVTVNQT